MAEFKNVLNEKEKESFGDLLKQGCSESSLERFFSSYELDFDGARQTLAEENPDVDLVCYMTEEGELEIEEGAEKNPEKKLSEKEQKVFDNMLSEGYSESSISTFFKNYKDGSGSALKELNEANPGVAERKEAERKAEEGREYNIYGELYDPILNPKREGEQVYDKEGKLKGEDDTDYEKMLSRQSAPDKKAEEEDILSAIYPKMSEKEDVTLTGLDAEYPSMQKAGIPDKREPVELTEEEKEHLSAEYPEMKDM